MGHGPRTNRLDFCGDPCQYMGPVFLNPDQDTEPETRYDIDVYVVLYEHRLRTLCPLCPSLSHVHHLINIIMKIFILHNNGRNKQTNNKRNNFTKS